MGVTALAIHSTVDFNLQIPANAFLFCVLLALGWLALFLERRGQTPVDKSVSEVQQAGDLSTGV